ncbi:hypothetical protein BRD56_11680 [Thermoplasmatales archaeon SW_10_69_26]|nr:MAG: hypothetical protein BRD56_11680 [Thermoplasmatales archaeon SW_10_69_26]
MRTIRKEVIDAQQGPRSRVEGGQLGPAISSVSGFLFLLGVYVYASSMGLGPIVEQHLLPALIPSAIGIVSLFVLRSSRSLGGDLGVSTLVVVLLLIVDSLHSSPFSPALLAYALAATGALPVLGVAVRRFARPSRARRRLSLASVFVFSCLFWGLLAVGLRVGLATAVGLCLFLIGGILGIYSRKFKTAGEGERLLAGLIASVSGLSLIWVLAFRWCFAWPLRLSVLPPVFAGLLAVGLQRRSGPGGGERAADGFFVFVKTSFLFLLLLFVYPLLAPLSLLCL